MSKVKRKKMTEGYNYICLIFSTSSIQKFVKFSRIPYDNVKNSVRR